MHMYVYRNFGRSNRAVWFLGVIHCTVASFVQSSEIFRACSEVDITEEDGDYRSDAGHQKFWPRMRIGEAWKKCDQQMQRRKHEGDKAKAMQALLDIVGYCWDRASQRSSSVWQNLDLSNMLLCCQTYPNLSTVPPRKNKDELEPVEDCNDKAALISAVQCAWVP